MHEKDLELKTVYEKAGHQNAFKSKQGHLNATKKVEHQNALK